MLLDRLIALAHATTLASDGGGEQWSRWVAAAGQGGMQVIDSLYNNGRLTRASGSRRSSVVRHPRPSLEPSQASL